MNKEASFWGSLRRVKAPPGKRPDFDRFLRAVTTSEPGPVPIGDSFADYEVMGALLNERVRNLMVEAVEGQKPDFTSVALPYAGYAAMRSGWERDANMLYFDFGPVGYRHAHQDKLQVMIWAYGRQVLFDPGRINYLETRHQNYCMDTFSHNTVLVDHRPQRRIWYEHPHPDDRPYPKVSDFEWESTPGFNCWIST